MRLAPVSTASVVLARVGVSLAVAFGQVVIFLAVAVAFFGLRLTGWWPMVFPLTLVGTLAFLSIGLLAGSVAKTEEAAVGLANVIVLPMAFLSGSFFSLAGAPAQVFSYAVTSPVHRMETEDIAAAAGRWENGAIGTIIAL